MDVFRTPEERLEGLPGYDFEPNYTEVDGLRLHHVDQPGSGPASGEAAPIVCFHGEPSWSYLYRKMVPPLSAAGHRVICPDLAGFGRSDKPTDHAWYTYDRHVEMVSAQLSELDLNDVVAVVHDWGGPIGLRWAVENADRVSALVILNTGLFTGRVSAGFMAWREFAEKNPDMQVGRVIQGGTATPMPEAVRAAYDAPFPTPESKAGPATFPLLVPTGDDEPGAPEMRAVSEALKSWEKPTLIAFSDNDPIFPWPKSGLRFSEAIPSAEEPIRVEGAAHFLQEDEGEFIAERVLGFLAEG
ncbi:MAG: alpha/beta fold hydrolase [Solirubrobacterales bacterium]|nr:alpha/beta fold hydrolase [Solirubrobacterales bacterium]